MVFSAPYLPKNNATFNGHKGLQTQYVRYSKTGRKTLSFCFWQNKRLRSVTCEHASMKPNLNNKIHSDEDEN